MTRQREENGELLNTMESNINKRTASIGERHQSEVDAFNAEQQDLEDDMFLEIQMHLRGKQDKDVREKRLQDKFLAQRQEKLAELGTRHRSQAEALQANAAMELQGVRLANDAKMARLEHKYRVDLEALVTDVGADRAWFRFLSERQQRMVLANNRLMLAALEEGRDPEGLTEEGAMTVGPFITDLLPDGSVSEDAALAMPMVAGNTGKAEPWSENLAPSPGLSASPARSLVELAAT